MNKLKKSDIEILGTLFKVVINKEKNSYELRLKASKLGFALVRERGIDPQKTRLACFFKFRKVIEAKKDPMRKWV